ncbi:MAG: 3-deoxy-manno-octulosonate cytidylyltransferase, partial [Bacteroidetes bacterium]|nr:3-deoxy-manno-octulosonate cytidylyltransferase [Bacteroidota bacterium]
DPEAFFNPNVVKLVTDAAGNALYFSRAPIPHDRDGSAAQAGDGNGSGDGGVYSGQIGIHRKHIGIYAFRREALRRFAALPPGQLEQLEKLEQLRALEHGLRIRVADVAADSQAVDTPEDLRLVEELLNNESS